MKSRASGGPEMPQRNRENISDVLTAMPVKVSVKDGKISNQTTVGIRLERFGEVSFSHTDDSTYMSKV